MPFLRQLALVFLAITTGFAQDSAWTAKKSGWQLITAEQRPQVENFADHFKAYLDVSRSSYSSTKEIVKQAKAAGFAEFTEPEQVKPGARLYTVAHARAVLLIVVGSEGLVSGSRVIGTHQDSPHIDLKARPVISRYGYALLKTIEYGGIKKYQWANLPLAIIGRVDTEDGRTVEVNIGLKTGDPVFVIPDNAPHSDRPLRNRTYTEVFAGEELNPVFASAGGANDSAAAEALRLVTSTYNIKEEDFVSSELHLVPATRPADVGIDRALVGSYGQDDRLSSFCAARAALDLKGTPRYTAIAYLSNYEETGSGNNSGAASELLDTTYARLLGAQLGNKYNDLDLRTSLRNAVVVSADTNDGINPIFGEMTSESSNAARLGYGPAIKIYGGSFNANSELTASIRGVLDRAQIPWQTQTPKVEVGGGGTIGYFMSAKEMNVIDVGVPLLSMHATYEMSSKVDVWNFYRFMTAFYQWDGK
jgi:aspartyl aminopeptidase